MRWPRRWPSWSTRPSACSVDGSRPDEGTRARLIEAVRRILAEKGYPAATIKAIAQEAHSAPGLIYHYFDDKDDLLLAVLRDAARRQGEDLLGSGPQPDSASATHGIPPAAVEEGTFVGSDLVRLRYALFALGLSDPKFLPALRELLAADRQSIQSGPPNGRAASRMREVPSALLLACFDGLALCSN